MSDKTCSDFMSPFDNASKFIKAMQIVKSSFCNKSLNYDIVMVLLNKFLGQHLPINIVIKFVSQITTYPSYYGYDTISNTDEFLSELYDHSSSQNSVTRILTPTIEECIFCVNQNVKLIFKNIPFAKNPILYAARGIGMFYLNIFCFNHGNLTFDLTRKV
jgi:hypothetical protein